MRTKYKGQKRNNLYLACEEMDFTWDELQVREFELMWIGGMSLYDIAKAFSRDPDEVMMLAVDRIRHGTIKKRPGGALGVMA